MTRDRLPRAGRLIHCRRELEDGSICEWSGPGKASIIHIAVAHKVVLKDQMRRRLRIQGDRGFYIAKHPPSFEECFRLEENPGPMKHLLFESDSKDMSSSEMKDHYRDRIRGLELH